MIRRHAWLLPLLVVPGLFIIRVAGPADLLDKDQPRPIAYILDAAADGHLIVQRDHGGDVTSKPPLYTWLASASSTVFGGNRFALYLPCALAVAGLAMLAYGLGRRHFGWAAAFTGALIVALNSDTLKQVALARTDAVFACCVAATAVLAFRAWERGQGWTWVWLMAGVATLAKTPLVLVFAGAGLCAAWWERRAPRGSHALGITLFLALTAGWFLAAWLVLGQALIDKMIGRELIGHAVASDTGMPLWKSWVLPPWWFAMRFLPWTVPFAVALWNVFRRPSVSPRRRRLERFLACWFLGGLVVLMLAPHKRIDLAFPLLVPAALLAGLQVVRWTAAISDRLRVHASLGLAAVLLIGMAVYVQIDRRKPVARASQDLEALAARLDAWRTRGIELRLASGNPVLRYLLDGWPQRVTETEAAAALAGPLPTVIAVSGPMSVPGAIEVPAGSAPVRVYLNRAAQERLR